MTKRILCNILLFLTAFALLTAPALAQGNSNGNGHGNGNGEGNGKGNGHGNKHKGNKMDRENDNKGQGENGDERDGRNVNRTDRGREGDRREVAVFGPRDRDIISGYYRNQYSNLPPGLAKRGGNLPPGLERQLERNGTLPPGLQRRVQPFPQALNSQLSPLPRYYTRGVIGDSVVVYNTRTRMIVDVIRNVLNR